LPVFEILAERLLGRCSFRPGLPASTIWAPGGDPRAEFVPAPEHRPSDADRLGDLARGIPRPPGARRDATQPSCVGGTEQKG